MKKATLISILISGLLILAGPVQSQGSATDSAQSVDFETVKENVKKRIQDVVMGEIDVANKRMAVMGRLESIAQTTLSIDTNEDVRLASTSATTAFIRLPGKSNISFDEVSIDDYIIALGPLDESRVLNAQQVLAYDEMPGDPVKIAFYGLVEEFNRGRNSTTIVLKNPATQESLTIVTDKNSTLELAVTRDIRRALTADDVVEAGSRVLAIYTPASSEKSQAILARLLLRPPVTSLNPETDGADHVPAELQP
jgi:hypothetical protein